MENLYLGCLTSKKPIPTESHGRMLINQIDIQHLLRSQYSGIKREPNAVYCNRCEKAYIYLNQQRLEYLAYE